MTKRSLPPLPKRLLENGRRPCRGCGAEVPTRRRTWCSTDCRETHYMALSGFARSRVYDRDKGICGRCGADTGFLERVLWELRRHDDADSFRTLKQAWGLSIHPWGTWLLPTMWEADHIIPLAEGGTNALDNYRTLCIPCHRRETRELAGRLTAKRAVLR